MSSLKTFLIIITAFFASFRQSCGITAALEWDESTDLDAVGYNLYYGPGSGQYTNVIPVGLTTSVIVSNLGFGVTYYFAVTSIDAAGLESDFSSEVEHFVELPPCTVVVTGLDQVYDGTPKAVSLMMEPKNLAFLITYSDLYFPPVSAGTYKVIAMGLGFGCVSATTNTLTIHKAKAALAVNDLVQIYDGLPKQVSTTTSPPDMAVSVAYNGRGALPRAAGFYEVMSEVIHPNYAARVTNTLTIEPAKAQIALGNLSQLYDGRPKQVSVTTVPPGIAVSTTYNRLANPPVQPGAYLVNATIANPNYTGSARAVFVISKSPRPQSLDDLTKSNPATESDLAQLNPAGPADEDDAPMILSWPSIANDLTIWRSSDMVIWTAWTNVSGRSTSLVIRTQPKPGYFRATLLGSGETSGYPLSIQKW